MSRDLTVSIVGPRWTVASHLRGIAVDKETGLISDLQIKKIGWFTWWLYYKVEVKS